MMAFEILETSAATRRVVLTGRLDSAGVAHIEAPLGTALMTGRHDVLFDLSGVSFAGSLGIRMFVSIAKAVHGTGHRLVLYGMRPAVMEVIEIVGLADLLPCVGNECDALALLAA